MSISNPQINNVGNYLVPASGQTHSATLQGIFSATPQVIDWRQFEIDNFPFRPQGVFIDNTLGIANLVINIQPINFNVICGAGQVGQYQFPAPDGQTCSITGSGQASVIFVDFPVLPNQGQTAIAGTANVNIVGPNPLPVSPTINAAGLPFQITNVPTSVNPFWATISGAGLTVTITPANNLNLKKLCLSLSENVTLAVAGLELITVTLNAIIIYKENVYIGAAISPARVYDIQLDFDFEGLNVGAGGLVVTIGTALATGILDINAYFG
jgi:hypothetical protein